MTPIFSRLYLVTPDEGDDDALLACLVAAATAGDVAALLIRGPNENVLASRAKALTKPAQDHDIAVLIHGNGMIATDVGADGMHVALEDAAHPSAIENAHKALANDSIVGVASPNSRHQAMQLAEQEPDYIAFDDHEMAMWWAPLFQVPCVALAPASLETAAKLAQAGVEFVCPSLEIWANQSDASRLAQLYTEAMADESSVA
ncbi:MAG: thiamine phosphate synthase [Hyphomicrobiales bacterium]